MPINSIKHRFHQISYLDYETESKESENIISIIVLMQRFNKEK